MTIALALLLSMFAPGDNMLAASKGGFSAVEARDLAGTRWTITRVDGKPVQTAANTPELSFSARRLSGASGCNRFSGSYRIAHDRLTIGPVMATQMACTGAVMTQEAMLFAILAVPVRITAPSKDVLVLSGRDGRQIRMIRAAPS